MIPQEFSVGIIGLGDMGQLYLNSFINAKIKNYVCDLPSKYHELQKKFYNHPLVKVLKDGAEVSRISDYIIYSVETENLLHCVKEYGKCTKVNAIVASQSSVKYPEIKVFEEYLPEDVEIITLHSLHGPSLSPVNQPLVLIPHRCSPTSKAVISELLSKSLKSHIVELSAEEHDLITADTQAVTHLAFLSMGTAWKNCKVFPWLNETYVGGIENVKVMMTLRIYSSKWHVYAGLAILNPSAKSQIAQYAKSVSELFKMMIMENEDEFRRRIYKARDLFKKNADKILLSDEWLNQFSLGSVPKTLRKPNSHLSMLAVADSWVQLGINPFDHMICQTPPFRSWLGIVQYLFMNKEMLEQAMEAALFDKSIRADDLEFLNATQGWAQTVLIGSMDGYKERFNETAKFFEDRADEGKRLSTKMLEVITQKYTAEINENQ